MSERLRPSSLTTAWLGHALRVYDETDSTSQRLSEWAAEGAPHGATVVAGRQTQGRGRQGRNWSSPEGNLYVSWLLRPSARRAGELAPLALVVGLAVATALREAFALDDIGIKWPNDVWIGGRKLAGVLLESRSGRDPLVVCGLGVNLRTPPTGWEPELRDRATALDDFGVHVTAGVVLGQILPSVERDTDRFLEQGLAPFLDRLRAASILRGRRVTLDRGGRPLEVDVLDIDESGALRVRTLDGEETIVQAGEVHLGGTAS